MTPNWPTNVNGLADAPRAGEQAAEGRVGVAGHQAARRVRQPDRRAQGIELVVIRAAGRDLAHQAQPVGVAGDQAARARVLADEVARSVGSTRFSVVWPLWIVDARFPSASYS